MNELLPFLSLGLSFITILFLLILFLRLGKTTLSPQSLQFFEEKFRQLENRIYNLEQLAGRHERLFQEEFARNREENNYLSRQSREELSKNLSTFNDSLLVQLSEISKLQRGQLDYVAKQMNNLTQNNEQKLEHLRQTVEERLFLIQQDNAQKLELMRNTVDEKLTSTLENRLGESFKLVSERLEEVHQGLGEMQSLASGVGDLKKVLTNVKTRGTWGEVQLGNLLEQILTPEQFATNVATKKGSRERVEFAIKIPSKEKDSTFIYLPIDAKFPLEDYQRLLDAQDAGDPSLVAEYQKSLEQRIKIEARSIRDKYISPPSTTDFGILFLPTEGLYAEVLRRPGLADSLQRDYKVVIAGPTTLAALLNSLQMGFRTLAIEKRSGEVWNLLSAVKTEFGKFTDILDKTQKKLQEASNTIESAARRSRSISRKLKNVETISVKESAAMLDTEDE
ncbi:MAG: DNA recombination protein RmuC [Desulfitobacterium sp.]|nr:DNA recombination protein RmuC [Desulfitobacterium sp.]